MAAYASWADARHQGGEWLIRMEDIDPPRELPAASSMILRALEALGLESAQPILWQSQRTEIYQRHLESLLREGQAFECRCSRTDLLASAGIHRGRCRSSRTGAAAVRLIVPDTRISFIDRIQGPQQQDLLAEVGDFVLLRRDGLFAYQLAVVVDDALQAVTDVVRGSDLLDSTARQIYLQRALGFPTPRYAHIPVVVDETGAKLSKQNLAPPANTEEPIQLLSRAAMLLGQQVGLPSVNLGKLLPQLARTWQIDRVPKVATIALD